MLFVDEHTFSKRRPFVVEVHISRSTSSWPRGSASGSPRSSRLSTEKLIEDAEKTLNEML